MFLSDIDIAKALKKGDVIISPFDKKRLQPASYDILLGNKFILTESHSTDSIDPTKKKFANIKEVVLKKGEVFVLHPGVSILGLSIDYFGSKKYLIQLHGKSSLARIGLMVHNTAGLVNPGHFLQITFELCNLNKVPIVLTPGMEIGQITFSQMSSDSSINYKSVDSKYIDKRWRVKTKSKKSKKTRTK
ncbi:MAG: dCTP deaminase [Parcubacteria group bacterium]